MANCEPYSDRLLDFVYGVLDEEGAQALRGHLEACPRCQETLRDAKGQQALFARAALPIGTDAVAAFNAPAEAPPTAAAPRVDGTPVPESPATIAFTPPAAAGTRRRTWRRYWLAGAAAAALLLITGTLAYTYQAGVTDRERFIVKQKDVVREIDKHLAALGPEYQRKAKEQEQTLRREAPPHLYTLVPAQIPPEGGAVVQFAVNGPDGKPANAKITMRLTDESGKRILTRKEVTAEHGMATVPLGEDLADALRDQTVVHLIAEAEAGHAKASLDEPLKVAAPGYIAHLMTNQTIYRPRELLLFRALVLDRASLTPPAQPIALRFSLVDARGRVVAGLDVATGAGGIAAGEMAVADAWPDGQYELRVAARQPGTVHVRPHARKLQLARDTAHIVQADRSWYRAGDIVNLGVLRGQAMQTKPMNSAAPNAELYLNDQRMPLLNAAPGGLGGAQQGGNDAAPPQRLTPAQTPPRAPPTGAPSPTAPPPSAAPLRNSQAGGTYAHESNNRPYEAAAKNAASQLQLQFKLPADIDTTHVRVKIVLTEGKDRETLEKELSVVPSRLSVDLFPEGGDLVAGVPNRVYYRVRTPRGEAVNPEGRVIVLSGTDVLLDSAPGAGTGSFTFTPQPGDTYSVRLTNAGRDPIELADPFARLGVVRQDGVVLHTPRPVAAEGEPVDVVLRNPGPARRVLLVAQCRGRFVGQQWVEANGAETRVAMGTLPAARGLVRLTAYDAGTGALQPLAERLIYRTPARRLDMSVLHLGGVIAPKYGQKSVQLQVRCRNESGESQDAWAVASIVADDSIRGNEPNPLAHFFFAGDVQGAEDLDNAVLLAADNPTTQQALDLFLGTVGWRRFQPARGEAHAAGVPVDAALVGGENASPKALQTQLETKLDEALTPLRLTMQQKHAQLNAERQIAQSVLAAAQSDLRAFEALPWEYFRIGLGLAIVTLLGLACLALAVGAWRLVCRKSATPLFAGSFACLTLCLITAVLRESTVAPAERGTQQVAEGTQSPHWLDLGRLFNVPAGLPTGPLALARSAAPEASKDFGDNPVAAKMAERQDRRNDGIAAQPREERSFPWKAHRQATARMVDSLKKLRQRFDDALSRQGAAPGLPGAGTSVTQEKGKTTSKTVELKKADADGAPREFIPDVVAGVEFDTLVWHPALSVNAGGARIAFDVPASAGSYRVLLLGNSADGRLGFYEGRLEIQPAVGR